MGTAPSEALLATLRTAVIVCLTSGATSSIASRVMYVVCFYSLSLFDRHLSEQHSVIIDSSFKLHFFPKFAEGTRQPAVWLHLFSSP